MRLHIFTHPPLSLSLVLSLPYPLLLSQIFSHARHDLTRLLSCPLAQEITTVICSPRLSPAIACARRARRTGGSAAGEEEGRRGTWAGRRQVRRRWRRIRGGGGSLIVNTTTADQARHPLCSGLRENQGRLPLLKYKSTQEWQCLGQEY